jgi:hypothetical protein
VSLSLKPAHATVKAYYEALHQFGQLYIDHEGAVRSAVQTLPAKCGQRASPKLTLVPEYRIERARTSVIVDGALVDLYHLPHGYWEAKDEKDDLIREIERKLAKGYPRDNIIFQAPERAILYQGGARVIDENITRPEALVDVVNQFFDYKAPQIQEWEAAVSDFSERIPELATAVPPTCPSPSGTSSTTFTPSCTISDYRERYAANLRRELPRIPFACNQLSTPCHSEPASAGEESAFPSPSGKQIPRGLAPTRNDAGGGTGDAELFRAFVRAGQRLSEIHVHYEQQPEYPLTKTEKTGEKLDWRVTKMRLGKDKTTLIYNQFLTLSGIPPETYEYRLGNRSAVEWVIDQYQVSTDKRSGITNDPNRTDEPQCILRLIGQVITVSLETVKIVRSLPPLGLPA